MDNLRRGAEQVCERLRENGHEALFAGGCVRDSLLGCEPKDYDVATSALPEEVEAIFEKTVPVGKAFGVILVVANEGTYEVATFRADGPYTDGRHPDHVRFVDAEADARRRDFTVNALFFDPETDRVLDFVGGQADLEEKRIRTVGDPNDRFHEDCLRLMRCIRFAAQLDFTIDSDTTASVQRLAETVLRASSERIRDELTRMLTQPRAGMAFRLLDETGLLIHVLPEIAAMKGVEQPPQFHPEGDVWVHTMLLLDHLENPTPTLAWSALLHDVGKPPTQTFDDRIRFNDHDNVGAKMATAICHRLKLPNEITDRVFWLVSNHMRISATSKMKESKRKRFVREEAFPELLELLRLDCLGSRRDLQTYEWIQDYLDSLGDEPVHPKPLVSGKDLIALGFTPGPRFREILETIEDAQLESRISTRDEALALLNATFPNEEA